MKMVEILEKPGRWLNTKIISAYQIPAITVPIITIVTHAKSISIPNDESPANQRGFSSFQKNPDQYFV